MSRLLTRREFLRSAGGITFLALIPAGRGLFAAPNVPGTPKLPLFTAMPYIQPGSNSALRNGKETMIVAWQTEADPAEFTVEFGPTKSYGGKAAVISATRGSEGLPDG